VLLCDASPMPFARLHIANKIVIGLPRIAKIPVGALAGVRIRLAASFALLPSRLSVLDLVGNGLDRPLDSFLIPEIIMAKRFQIVS
jgi:hypothetical protein